MVMDQEQPTQENGKEGSETGKESKYGQMEQSMKATGRTIELTAKESSYM